MPVAPRTTCTANCAPTNVCCDRAYAVHAAVLEGPAGTPPRTPAASEEGSAPSSCNSSCPCGANAQLERRGIYLVSCCDCCNIFTGITLLAVAQFTAGATLLMLLIIYSEEYDRIHESKDSQAFSVTTGMLLSIIMGAGAILAVSALTDKPWTLAGYLVFALIAGVGLVCLGLAKIARACVGSFDKKMYTANDLTDVNLACSYGLTTFAVAVFYAYGLAVVSSFYHHRYLRRALLFYEARCTCGARG